MRCCGVVASDCQHRDGQRGRHKQYWHIPGPCEGNQWHVEQWLAKQAEPYQNLLVKLVQQITDGHQLGENQKQRQRGDGHDQRRKRELTSPGGSVTGVEPPEPVSCVIAGHPGFQPVVELAAFPETQAHSEHNQVDDKQRCAADGQYQVKMWWWFYAAG